MGQAQGCLGRDAGGVQNSEALLRSSAVQAGYELKRWLGAGSTGEVWLAEEAATSRSYALKFIKLDGAKPKPPASFTFCSAAAYLTRIIIVDNSNASRVRDGKLENG